LAGVAAAVFCWLLLGLAATDAETMLLPDALTLPGLAIGVVYSALRDSPSGLPLGLPLGSPLGSPSSWRPVGESLLCAACAGGFILLIRGGYWLVRRREGIGLGDAKLLAMIAAWLGLWPTVLSLFLGVVGAAVYGLLRVAVRRGRTQSLRVPLGAFLSAAAIFTVFEGDAVIRWYLSFWP
jgi:leader peptidase (prepilin peptidase)/N-methyltransferase